MLKMTIDNEEVVSNKNFTIKEEMLNASSTILNNTYPKTWEQDKDYITRFYFPRDYAKLNIQNHTIVQDYEAGTTVQVNGSATLTDVDTSKNSKVTKLLGQTSQQTYTGKNLLPINIESGSTKNGLTIAKNKDGSYTLNGTSTANTTWDLYTGENITIPIGTYTGSIVGRTNITDGYIRLNNGAYQTIFSNTSDTNTFTINEPFTFNRFYIYISNNKTFNNQIIKLQLEKGSSATSYEPYVGGIPSPNPNYPQPVNVVSGDNYIDICGKNLFDKDNYNIAYGYTGGSLVLTNANVRNRGRGVWFRLEPNTTYTYTQSKLNNDTDKILGFYNGIPTTTGMIAISRKYFTSGTTNINYTFTTDSEYIYLHVKFFDANSQTGTYTFEEEVSSIQLEKGSTATTYEPYIGHSYPIYLGVENIFTYDSVTNQYTYITPCSVGDKFTMSFRGSATSSQRVFLRTYDGNNPPTSTMVDNVIIYVTTTSTDYTATLTSTTDGYLYMVTSASPTNYTLENIKITKGDHLQYITDTPIELCKIGTYQDSIYKGKGYNLFDKDTMIINSAIDSSTGSMTASDNFRTIAFKCKPSTTYTISKLLSNRFVIGYSTDEDTTLPKTLTNLYNRVSDTIKTFTTNNDTNYVFIMISKITDDTTPLQDLLNSIMIVEGSYTSSTIPPFEPYNSKDKWLLHKEIGKVVLDGSEDWSKSSNTSVDRFIRSSTIPKATQGISNYFSVVTSLGTIVGTFYFNENQQVVNYSSYGTTTLATFKTWLSSNKPIIYYVLATPTNTEITDETLLAQLDDLESS